MNYTADRLNGANAGHPAPVTYTPEQEELRLHGLRILARMIVKAYLWDQHELPNILAGVQTRSQAAPVKGRSSYRRLPHGKGQD